MTNDKPDWIRLQKALSVEAEHGFSDIMGNQYRFSEFLCLSFGQNLTVGTPEQKSHWQEMAAKFADYPNLSLSQRKHLVASSRRFLYDLKQSLEAPDRPPKPKLPRTTSLTSSVPKSNVVGRVTLDQPLSALAEVGRKSNYLERLGLYTVRDLLFYYPRDHIDYARQVPIANVVPGETVTLIGTVKSCSCFSSPKNKKLTIFDLVLKDHTGKIKLNRFFAGTRFNNRGWQQKMKNQYPIGSAIAASGLVKKNKYGLTLDNPEIEVLDSTGSSIDSMKIGRILPVYALTEGVQADMVRKAVIASLPAVERIKDPLPRQLRELYGLIGLKDAIANIHFPNHQDTLSHARRRLVL